MKKMSMDSIREINGGCNHVACMRWSVTKQPLFRRYKYVWLCSKCSGKFTTYAYY
ncbi:MAG: hypothetical protein ACI4I6_08415 [Hominimerdicola sp.]